MMSNKIVLEIEMGEMECVEAPVLYSTPIGEFNHINKVNAFIRVTEFIQRSEDDIVNMSHRNRQYFLKGLVEDFCSAVFDEKELHYYIQSYDAWLSNFRESVGLKFETAEFCYSTKCNGQKYKLKDYPALFLTERELIKTQVQNFLNGSFEYNLVQHAP